MDVAVVIALRRDTPRPYYNAFFNDAFRGTGNGHQSR